MAKAIPQIHEFMTPTPLTIGADQMLLQARAMMRESGIRHLPVLVGGRLEGILSDRDLSLVESAGYGISPGLLSVVFDRAAGSALSSLCIEAQTARPAPCGLVLIASPHRASAHGNSLAW